MLAGLLVLCHAAVDSADHPELRELSPVALEPALQVGQYLPYDDSPCDTWTGLPSSDAEALAPMECGVLWFLHIPKTGGTTIQHHFHDHAAKQGWEFVNMWKLDVPEEERSEQPPGAAQLWGVWDESPDSGREYWAAWNTSRAWKRVLKEANSPKPKLIVHAHHNMPGLGDPYFVEQVMEPMRRSLSAKGCDMRLATILREPVAEVTSLMLFNKIPQEEFVEKMEHHADAMSKYVTFNYETQWPIDFKQPGRTPWELGGKILAVARDILSEFSLVGRTEDLDPFMRGVNQVLGWPLDLHSKAWRTGRENEESLPPPYTPTPEQVDAVKAVNVIDSQLYHTFCAEPAEQPAEAGQPQAGEQAGQQGALTLLGGQPQKRASGLVAAASLAQTQAAPAAAGGSQPNNCGLVDANCVFGSLTTVPYRLSYLASILQVRARVRVGLGFKFGLWLGLGLAAHPTLTLTQRSSIHPAVVRDPRAPLLRRRCRRRRPAAPLVQRLRGPDHHRVRRAAAAGPEAPVGAAQRQAEPVGLWPGPLAQPRARRAAGLWCDLLAQVGGRVEPAAALRRRRGAAARRAQPGAL